MPSQYIRRALAVQHKTRWIFLSRGLLHCRRFSSSPRFFSSSASNPMSKGSNMLLVVGGIAIGTSALLAFKAGVFSKKPIGESETKKKKPVKPEETGTSVNVEEPVKAEDPVIEKEPVIFDLPDCVPYLLIGGGTASFTAMKVIQEKDPDAKILIVTEEDFVPYMRPPLSKELWFSDNLQESSSSLQFKQWNGKERSLFYKKEDFYMEPIELNEKSGVAIAKGVKVKEICQQKQCVILENDQVINYEKLLIATGGQPRNLSLFANASAEIRKKVTLFRNIDDFRHLVDVTQNAKSVAIVGGGFLGSELACALGRIGAENDLKITQIFPETGNMGAVFPKYLSNWTTDQVKKEGVIVVNKSTVSSVSSEDGKVLLKTDNGKEVLADHVVVAVGIEVDSALASSSGLEVDSKFGGFHVNAELQAASNIWVAGDASCFYDFKLGCRRRVEHHDHAVVSGRLAGENMTGGHTRYEHQSMFWSDLGPKIGYEAIGIVDSSLQTVSIWGGASVEDTPKAAAESSGTGIRSEAQDSAGEMETSKPDEEVKEDVLPGQSELEEAKEASFDFGKGVVFYLKNQKIVGILCWNVFNQIPVARRIIDEGNVYSDSADVYDLGKAFKIFPEK
eukprot:m.308889 g.308889  ORF g.308889 m.308889 type:complete len:620 (+) comp44998_c0_seq1:54-1913(+)